MSLFLHPGSNRMEREDSNTSILKNKKLGADAIQQKKHALTQEFRESYRERNVKAAESTADVIKPNEHKLRFALDSLLGENQTKNNKLNEARLRLSILKRDDISGIEVNEKEIERKSNETKGFSASLEIQPKDGKDLVERFAYVKKTYQNLIDRRTEEEEAQKILDAKVAELSSSQKVLIERIGKKEKLYNMMEKRFLNLGKVEFAAKNKLTRTSNKLLSLKKEKEKQRSNEDEFFKKKKTVLKRTHSVVEQYKNTIAKNLIYLEEIRLKKEEVDDRLDEVDYEEKQIVKKRQASEYILLYIELLESLENDFIKKMDSKKTPKISPAASPHLKLRTQASLESEQTSKKRYSEFQQKRQSFADTNIERRHSELPHKRQSFADTNMDRDIIITKIAQFYDQHPSGTETLVDMLLKIYHDMLLNEQSLGMRYQDLNTQRLEAWDEIEHLEKALQSLENGFIIMEDEAEDQEEASPEHGRETERKVVGMLGKYDLKTVKLGEYLVNISSTGIEHCLTKLANASCSLCAKSGDRIPSDLAEKAKEAEEFLLVEKQDYSVPDLLATKNKSSSRALTNGEDGSIKETSSSVRHKTSSLTVPSPREAVLNLQRIDKPGDKKENNSKNEDYERMVQSQCLIAEEFTNLEQLFKSSIDVASPEILYKWNERIFEAKWILDYLSKDDIKKILDKQTFYYGDNLTEEMLKNIVNELKNQARLLQRERSYEVFDLTTSLLTLFRNHYQKKKSELSQRFNIEIQSEILDDLNHILAVSDHVEKAHDARYRNMFTEPVEEPELWRKSAEKQSDSDTESELLVALRVKIPAPVIVKSTRESIAELHSHYLRDRRGLVPNASKRSNSVPKLRVVIHKPKQESGDSFEVEETVDQKAMPQSEKKPGVSKAKLNHTTYDGFSKRKNNSTLRNSQANTENDVDLIEEEKDDRKAMMRKTTLAPIVKEKKIKYPIPSMYFREQTKSKDLEEFRKKMIKDEEILRKISLLEKRQTEFDIKSKDYEKGRDYIPNFGLLQKYDLNREKNKDRIIKEWWKRQETSLLDLERTKSAASFILPSEKKDGRGDQQTDSTKNILCSQQKKLISKIAVKACGLTEDSTIQSSRVETGENKTIKKMKKSNSKLFTLSQPEIKE